VKMTSARKILSRVSVYTNVAFFALLSILPSSELWLTHVWLTLVPPSDSHSDQILIIVQ